MNDNAGGCFAVFMLILICMLLGWGISDEFTTKKIRQRPAIAWRLYQEALDYEIKRHKAAMKE